MTAETKQAAAAETASTPEMADEQPAPDFPYRTIDCEAMREALKRTDAMIEARKRRAEAERTAAAETAPAPEAADERTVQDPKGIDQEALKRLDPEIEAMQRAEAERTAAAGKKPAAAPKPQPQPETRAQTIREYLDSAPIKGFNARIIETCQKHGISLDSPWPPQIPEEGKPETQPAPAPAPAGKGIQLDFWEDGRRAAPNIVFRSALFPALKFKEGRPFLKKERIFATKGGEVYFTGEQFDQSDLDVYLEILQFARPFPLGTPVRFTAYSMLKALGRNTGKSDREWLHAVLTRLRGGTVDMIDHKKGYFGGLIEGGIYDEITTHYEIIINPQFAVLFGYGMWSTLDRAQRQALKQNQTAKVLHAYYASHAAPGPHDYATLAEIAGLTDKNPRKMKMKIIAAHEAMKRTGFMPDYEAGAKSITPKINHTPGQTQHIVKKIIRSRKAKKARDSGNALRG